MGAFIRARKPVTATKPVANADETREPVLRSRLLHLTWAKDST